MMRAVDPDLLFGRSPINPVFTRRQVYDLYVNLFHGKGNIKKYPLTAQNALREFGNYLPKA